MENSRTNSSIEENEHPSTMLAGSSCSEEDILINSLEEESVGSESIIGTTKFSARPRTVREIFPWLITIRNRLNLNLESEQAQKNVLPIMESYLRFIKNDLHTCFRYPNRCYILSKNITKMLILFKDINKSFVDSHEYLITLCDLLGIYTSLELKYSTKFEEPKMLVANRIVLNYETHLQFIDRSYILRIFISIKKFFQQKEIMCKIFEKYLKHNRYTQQELTDKIYIMYLIAFKYWRSLEDTDDEKLKIDEIANSFMKPSPQLRRNTYYAPFLPPYTANNDATKFILSHHFNPALLIKAFYSEELHCNDNTSMNRITDLCINEAKTNMNQIDLTGNASNKNSRLQMSAVKLEKPEVVAIIDLTAEDQLRKQELYWLNNLIQKARAAMPIYGLHISKNVASNIVDIIDLEASDDSDDNMNPKNENEIVQAIETNILSNSSVLDPCSSKNIEVQYDSINNPEKTVRPERRNSFDDNENSQNNDNKVIPLSYIANLSTQTLLGESKLTDENNEISLEKDILTPLNKNEMYLSQNDVVDNIVVNASMKENAVTNDKQSINMKHDKKCSTLLNDVIDDLKESSPSLLEHNTNLASSTIGVQQIEEKSKHGTNISGKAVKSDTSLESCKNIENISFIPLSNSHVSINSALHHNAIDNTISRSAHTISNILSEQTNLTDSLVNTHLDHITTVTETCKEFDEEICQQNIRSENCEQFVLENQKRLDKSNNCKNIDNADILNRNKVEQISMDDANSDLALDLKTNFELNNEKSKKVSFDPFQAENCTIIDPVDNENTNETELNLLVEHKSATTLLNIEKHSGNKESDSEILDNRKLKSRSNQLDNYKKYCLNSENNTHSTETDFVTKKCSSEQGPEFSNIKPIENESNINMQIKHFLKNTFSNDHDNVEKIDVKIRTVDNTKNCKNENKARLSSTTTTHVEMKDTVDSAPFNTSSDSDLLSILYESDQIDDENSDLNPSTDIDDIPIDKISPSNAKAPHGKSSMADNVIFSTTTNTRSSLPLSKMIDVKPSSKNSNVVFSTSKQILRKENSVTMQKQSLNDNWIDPAIDFVENSIGMHQNEIVSPPMEEFTKSDKTLFETFMNNVTETTAVKNVRFQDDLVRTRPNETELNTKEPDSFDKPKSNNILTNTGPLPQSDFDDNFKFNKNLLQIKKSVKFRDFPQEAADKTTKCSLSNITSGKLIKNFTTAAKIPGKERWATLMSTYNSEIDNTKYIPPTTSHQPIYSTINMKNIRPVTPRTSDADQRNHNLIGKNAWKLDKKIFNAQICVKRIDNKINLPLLKNQKKKTVKKSLSDFDRYLQKKLEKPKKQKKQITFATNIISSLNEKKVRIQHCSKGKVNKMRINSYELKKSGRSKKNEIPSKSVHDDYKLKMKVTVQLEDIASNPEYNQYFKGKHSVLKQPIFLGTHEKSKSLDNISKLNEYNPVHNFRLHLGEDHAIHKEHTKTANPAAVLKKRRNTIAPEIVVHVFKDSVKKNKAVKLRNSNTNVSKKINHDLNESSLPTNDQNQAHISISQITNERINYLNHFRKDSESSETISGHKSVSISALSENICNTTVRIPKLCVKDLYRIASNIDRDYDPVPKINIKPNQPPEPDKNNIQTVANDEPEHCINLRFCEKSSVQFLNKDDVNSSNESHYSIEKIGNKKALSQNSCNSNYDCISTVDSQDMNQELKIPYFERDDEVTSTQGNNIRNKILTCDSSNAIISLTQTDVQNDLVDTSSLTDSIISPRKIRGNDRVGRRKSMNLKSTHHKTDLYSGEWPKRRKTLSEATLIYKEHEDIVNMPSTTTILDLPRRKRGRPKGSTKNQKYMQQINDR